MVRTYGQSENFKETRNKKYKLYTHLYLKSEAAEFPQISNEGNVPGGFNT